MASPCASSNRGRRAVLAAAAGNTCFSSMSRDTGRRPPWPLHSTTFAAGPVLSRNWAPIPTPYHEEDMSTADLAPAYIRAISPYLPGKPITELAREMGIPVDSIVKLASNENPLGMSPKARAAMEKAAAGIERYPDNFDLTRALAGRYDLGMNQIVVGNGSNDVLDLAARVFLAPGRSAVFSRHAFAVYPLATMATGAECIATPAKNHGHDL